MRTAKEALADLMLEFQRYSDEAFKEKIQLWRDGDREGANEAALEASIYKNAVTITKQHIEALQND